MMSMFVRTIGPVLISSLLFGAGYSIAGSSMRLASHQFRVVAYVAGWSMPAEIPAERLTHINFAFGKIGQDGSVVLPDAGAGESLRRLVELRKRNPALEILVSIGGWGAEGFSDAALTDASRAKFAASAVELLRRHLLDGIDLDWEYPGQNVAGIKSRPEDKQNFTLLTKELRRQFDAAGVADKKAYLLTIAGADREYFEHTEMAEVQKSLDWINVMSYDFFNSLTSTTGHHAGLYRAKESAPADRNADKAIHQYLAAGVPSNKLVLGVAFYGRAFAGVRALSNGVNQPYEKYDGDHSYAELVDKFIGKNGFVRHWDEVAQAPYLWNGATRAFISYDDPHSVGIKTRYAKTQHLGGVMFWELSQDRGGELLQAITDRK
jgi:chitinase